MFNPFTEVADGDAVDTNLVEQAKNGNGAALEELILRHQAWIYNIAVRMVFQPQDAEAVTQEVLIKVITNLSAFRGDSKFRTWLYRIAGQSRSQHETAERGDQEVDVRRVWSGHRQHT